MKKALLLVLVVLPSCGGGGGGGDSSSCRAFKVVNGQECSSDSLPVVALLINGKSGCTGTFISSDYVLTAAHCTTNLSSVEVIHDRGEQSADLGGPNPLFAASGGDPAFDIGLVRVPGMASSLGIKPAEILASRLVQPNDEISVVGYGKDGTGSLANGNPRGVTLTVVAHEQGVIATRFDDSNSGACQGDSGAAATFDGQIVGTVSSGKSGCGAGNINIFASMQINGNVEFLRTYVPGLVIH